MINTAIDNRVSWLNKQLVQISDDKIVLIEKNENGKAELECRVKNYTIAFPEWDKKTFSFVECQKCADGILFEKLPSNNWVIHILELKSTMNSSEWDKTKKQLNGAVIHGCACMGVLGITNIENIKFYAAYKKEKISVATDPVLSKIPVGKISSEHTIADWREGKIIIPALGNKLMNFDKIKLDPSTGQGSVSL